MNDLQLADTDALTEALLRLSTGNKRGGGDLLPLDVLVLKRDEDGKLSPIRIPLGTGHDIRMRPLTFGQMAGYPTLLGRSSVEWTPEDKARLIAENLVEPDLHGHWRRKVWDGEAEGALSDHQSWRDWLINHVGWEDIDVLPARNAASRAAAQESAAEKKSPARAAPKKPKKNS